MRSSNVETAVCSWEDELCPDDTASVMEAQAPPNQPSGTILRQTERLAFAATETTSQYSVRAQLTNQLSIGSQNEKDNEAPKNGRRCSGRCFYAAATISVIGIAALTAVGVGVGLNSFKNIYRPELSSFETCEFLNKCNDSRIFEVPLCALNEYNDVSSRISKQQGGRQGVLDQDSCAAANLALWQLAVEQLHTEDDGDSLESSGSLSNHELLTRFVLYTFYFSTTSGEDLQFMKDTETCLWDGVICNRFGHVIVLDRSNAELRGSLPTELGLLTELRALELGSNALTGTLVTQLGLLTKLETLSIPNNHLSGDLTVLFAHMSLPQLERLELQQNFLTGRLDNANFGMPNLQIVRLGSNLLGGSLPTTSLRRSPFLQLLDLSDNHLTGFVDTYHSFHSDSMQYLDFTGNSELDFRTLDLAHLTLLVGLHLRGTKKPEDGAVGADWWESLKSLRYMVDLDLSDLSLRGSIPTDLAFVMPFLESLRLSANFLTGTLPLQLAFSKRLQNLDLSSNHLNGTIPTEIGTLYHLESLFLQDNDFTGQVPSAEICTHVDIFKADLCESANQVGCRAKSDQRTKKECCGSC